MAVSGDMNKGSGMAGTLKLHSPSGDTSVTYNQGAIVENKALAQAEHSVDGVAYSLNQSEMDAMIEDHYKGPEIAPKSMFFQPEKFAKSIFAQTDNAEVKRHQDIALGDLQYSKYNEGSDARLARYESEERLI